MAEMRRRRCWNVTETCGAYTFPGLLPRHPKDVSVCSVVLDRDGSGEGGGGGIARFRFGTVPTGGVQLVAIVFLSTILHLYTA